MTKAQKPITTPKAIALPGAPEIFTTLDSDGKHHIRCDLCGSDITLTVTAHPRFFWQHRQGEGCVKRRRAQGLPDPDPPVCNNIPLLMITPPSATIQTGRPSRIPCPGNPVQWTPGSIWETYPYHQHEVYTIGWRPVGFNKEENEIILCSDDCQNYILDSDEPPCKACWHIVFSKQYKEFEDRAKEVKDHTPWELLTSQQMCALLQKMAATIKVLRTQLNNADRRNQNLQIKLDDHTRMIMLLGTHDVPGLRCLIAPALRRGISARILVLRLQQAIDGVYRPHSGFNQRDHDIAFLVKSIAGSRLLYTLQKSHGLPSAATVRKGEKAPRLLSSIGMPSASDMSFNMDAFLDPSIKLPPRISESGLLPGVEFEFDSISIESKCRYCSRRDCVTGICREHASNINPIVSSFAAIGKLRTALFDEKDEDKKACFGSDATVVALASYARSDHYRPVPLIVSPTDKMEKGESLALWMRTIIDQYAIHQYGEKMHGPIYALASDGDSSFRKARQILCMTTGLDPQSELGKILCSLVGLNVWTSQEGITGTCDPKHVFKRFATLLRNPQGFMICDTLIMATDIISQLAFLPNMSTDNARTLLSPIDRQNVPKAVSLIQHLQLIQKLPVLSHPGSQNSRHKLNFMAHMLGSFLLPFITIEMSLSDQLKSLSTYAHLAAAMYILHGTACLTGALYADSQAIVKNIFFTVARLQLVDRGLNYFIIMEGTDRLENLFCECRTQDHAGNFDIDQLCQKLGVATLIDAVYERNPDLNRGHRKLNLTEAIGTDRINPESWEGNTCVGNVDLRAEWDAGRNDALATLREYFGDEMTLDFTTIFSDTRRDILRPMGDYVGVRATADDTRSEEEPDDTQAIENSRSLLPAEPNNSNNNTGDTDEDALEDLGPVAAYASEISNANNDIEFEEDALDMDGIELDDLFPETQEELENELVPDIFSHKLVDGDKEYLKSALVAALRPDQWKRLTVRPFRVRGKTLESLYQTSKSSVTCESGIRSQELNTKDLVALLVRSQNQFCLAVMEIIGFRFKKEKTLRLAMGIENLTNAKNEFKVNGQILQLAPSSEVDCSWEWTKRYVNLDISLHTTRLTRPQFILEVSASLIYPVNGTPIRISPTLPDTTWRITKADMDAIIETAWESLKGDGEDILANLPMIPTIKNPSAIPYKDSSSLSEFCVKDVPTHLHIKEKLSTKTTVQCRLCPENLSLNKMRGHVGVHILYSMRSIQEPVKLIKQIGSSPCGFCGLDSTCQTQFSVKRNGSHSITSTCEYHYEKMQYKAAQEATKSAPCTNVPIHCPLCPPTKISGEPRTIWKYNAIYHLLSEHSQDGIFDPNSTALPKIPGAMAVDMFISQKEERWMRIPTDATLQNREAYDLPGSDDIEGIKEEMKRERPPTVSVVEPSEKRQKT